MGVPVDLGVAVKARPSADSLRESEYLDRLCAESKCPAGIAAQLRDSVSDFPFRYWIIDNSGSMATADGHKQIETVDKGGKTRVNDVTVSRWEELGDSILWHASLAANLSAHTEFRLLNAPGRGCPQKLVCGAGHDPQAEVDAVRNMLRTSPTGRTPLCEQIRIVAEDIAARAPELRSAGKRCVLVVASDGAATDGDVAAAMRPLLSLPVWVVVRLCTDDEGTVSYWNTIDEDLELDMDVLDDLSSEATEVAAHSPWLAYGQQLHRLREWGCSHKVFDILDEKPLSPTEMTDMIALLLGGAADDLPHPQVDWPAFEVALAAVLKTAPRTIDPIRRRECAWIDVKTLRNCYTGAGDCKCVIC